MFYFHHYFTYFRDSLMAAKIHIKKHIRKKTHARIWARAQMRAQSSKISPAVTLSSLYGRSAGCPLCYKFWRYSCGVTPYWRLNCSRKLADENPTAAAMAAIVIEGLSRSREMASPKRMLLMYCGNEEQPACCANRVLSV